MKIAVLGAGLAGVSAAFYLAKQGHQVVLVERESRACSKTSFANGGQLSYDYVDPLASPVILRKLPRLLLGLDNAFKVGRGNTVDLLPWVLRFLRNCTVRTEQGVMEAMWHLASSSAQEVHKTIQDYGFDFDHRPSGKLHVYHDKKEFAMVREKVRYKQTLGIQQHILSVQDCLSKEPALQHSQQEIVGATFSPSDELGDAYRFSQALLNIAIESYGVTLQTDTTVSKLELKQGNIVAALSNQGKIEADHYVVAMGAYSPLLLKPVGISLPIYPMKGYSVTLPASPYAPKISITDAKHKMVISTLGDTMRVAGFAHFKGYDLEVYPKYIDKMITASQTLLPKAADYGTVLHRWTGLRPMSPDSQPIIGATKVKNLWLNTGHGMLGWTLMMGSGKRLADLMQEKLTKK